MLDVDATKTILAPLVAERRRAILEVMAATSNSATVDRKSKARQALAALDALEKWWTKASKPVAPKPEPVAGGAHGENPSGQVDEATQEQQVEAAPTEGTAEDPKAFETGGTSAVEKGGSNQPRVPAGSPTGGQFASTHGKWGALGSKFSSMDNTSRGEWLKEHQADYDNDPDFRAVVDAATVYSQGGYQGLRDVGEYASTGAVTANLQSVLDHPGDYSVSSTVDTFGEVKNYFGGQNIEQSSVSLLAGGTALQAAVASAPKSDKPYYRGVGGRQKQVEEPSEKNNWTPVFRDVPPPHSIGDAIDIVGATSFTSSEKVADSFSRGTASGMNKKRPRDRAIVYEVRAGARVLPISHLSPWKQQEGLLNGRFKVVSIHEGEPYFSGTGKNRKRITPIRYVLEQEDTYAPQTS